MNWFDILKLGGEDLNGVQYLNLGNENPIHDYDDRETSSRIGEYFYNLTDKATTRPHFEHQAKKPKRASKIKIKGNLLNIVDKISNLGKGIYYSFTDEDDSSYVLTYQKKKVDDPYEKSFLGLTPKKLDNISNVIAFDSVYASNALPKHATFKPIWPNDDERIKMFNLTPEEKRDMRLERSDVQRKIDKHKGKMKNPKANRNLHQEKIDKLEKRKEEINMLLGGRDDFDFGTPPKRRRRR